MKGILRLLFPPKCIFCGTLLGKGEDGFCKKCGELELAEKNAVTKGEFFDRGYFALWYEGDVRKTLHRFKFSGKQNYAPPLARIMQQVMPQDGRYDIITAVPTNPKNIQKRGYNHAALLAKELSVLTGVEYKECLKKTRNTDPMFGLKPHSRRANVLDAFEAKGDFAGARILLVDDIFTTGATASECARILKLNGAAVVELIVIASPR